jgi:hypothetical protein
MLGTCCPCVQAPRIRYLLPAVQHALGLPKCRTVAAHGDAVRQTFCEALTVNNEDSWVMYKAARVRPVGVEPMLAAPAL